MSCSLSKLILALTKDKYFVYSIHHFYPFTTGRILQNRQINKEED